MSSSKKLNIEHEYQQTKLKRNIVVLKKYFICICAMFVIWCIYEIFLYVIDQQTFQYILMIIALIICFIICICIMQTLTRKGWYRIIQAIIIIISMLMLYYNMDFHSDLIATRQLNPEKTLPYIVAIEHVLFIIMLINIMSSYYFKISVLFIYFTMVIYLLHEFDHKKFCLNIIIVGAQILINAHLFQNNYQTIYKYLKRLEHNWKQMIDDLHEGIIIFNKNFKILYENNQVKPIFGINNQINDKQISLKVHDLMIYELKYNQSILQLNQNRKLVFEENTQKEYISLEDYLKWIVDHTKMGLQKRNHQFKRKYSIQSKITNNKKKEVLLEQILKVQQFKGELVYSINIRINQDFIINQFKSQNKLRSLMVGAISHDVRTPLNGIIINIDQAYENQHPDPNFLKETFLKPARINCKILMCLIDQFINYTKEEFNQDIRMVYEKVDIRDIVEQMKAMFSMRAIIRKIKLIFQIDDLIPESFITDAQKLRQILQNLISNSMKFTTLGYIKVQLKLLQIQNKMAIKFSVIDTGYGIKKEDQKDLFKLFGQVEETKGLNKFGTGIGLHQSNKLAKKLGFSNEIGINLESQLGKGSTFSFIIENKEIGEGKENKKEDEVEDLFEIVEEEEKQKEREEEKEEDGEEEINISNQRDDVSEKKNEIIINKTKIPKPIFCCPNILVVDDDAINVKALKIMLMIQGYASNYTFQGQVGKRIQKTLKKEKIIKNIWHKYQKELISVQNQKRKIKNQRT